MSASERAAALVLALIAISASGCAARVRGVRFENRAPVWRVEDRRPIPQPRAIESYHNAEEMRDARAPTLHVLRVPGHVPARGVNSLGEVPDSSWFENRIGLHDLSPEAISHGPGKGSAPVPPLIVLGMKDGGHGLGVRVEDALGVEYLLKFDSIDAPAVETTIGPIVQRLLWAAGYHVPEDDVIELPRSELLV
ncbi:MAG: hypothetical protein H5U40_17235, partial [Polyangiaceae bacterium]|nr:hypothetical protein [Polyangiaceae bacterium]